jgi:hypothetical protein
MIFLSHFQLPSSLNDIFSNSDERLFEYRFASRFSIDLFLSPLGRKLRGKVRLEQGVESQDG